MHFLIDANLPRSVADRVRALGHEASDLRDIGLGDADDSVVADRARQGGLALITRDFDFADVRNYPPKDFAGIIVVDLPNDVHASVVVSVVEAFLGQTELVARLPGNLAIAEAGRVRFRSA